MLVKSTCQMVDFVCQVKCICGPIPAALQRKAMQRQLQEQKIAKNPTQVTEGAKCCAISVKHFVPDLDLTGLALRSRNDNHAVSVIHPCISLFSGLSHN